MRRLALLLTLPLALAACGELRQQALEWGDKPYNSAWLVVPLAVTTPPLKQVLFGPCNDEFGMPEARRESCDLYYKVRMRSSPWGEATARAQAMNYGPGELQCWRTLGTAECVAIGGPPRTVNMIGPNMGAN